VNWQFFVVTSYGEKKGYREMVREGYFVAEYNYKRGKWDYF
jgi:hypothetical protein